MSTWPVVITGGPVTIAWGNLAAGGYQVTYPARAVLDVPPGSLLEAQIGTSRFRRVTDAERAQDGHLDHSVLTN